VCVREFFNLQTKFVAFKTFSRGASRLIEAEKTKNKLPYNIWGSKDIKKGVEIFVEKISTP